MATIILRTTKGTPLTLAEVDQNFTNINTEIATSTAHLSAEGLAHAAVTSTVNGFMSASDKLKLDGVATGATSYSHPTSGVGAGSYKIVSVDINGHVHSGLNPTTLSGFGITDAVKKTSDTGAAHMPVGTTAQRPVDPDLQYGDERTNSDLNIKEWWNGTNWVSMGGGQMLGNALVKGISFNSNVIAEDILIPANTNAYSVGPMELSNALIEFGDNSTWTLI